MVEYPRTFTNNLLNSYLEKADSMNIVYRNGYYYDKSRGSCEIDAKTVRILRYLTGDITYGTAIQLASIYDKNVNFISVLTGMSLIEICEMVKLGHLVIRSDHEFSGYHLENFFESTQFPLVTFLSEKYLDKTALIASGLTSTQVCGRISQIIYEKFCALNNLNFKFENSLVSFCKRIRELLSDLSLDEYLDTVIELDNVKIYRNKLICMKFKYNVYEGYCDVRK